MSSNSFKVKNSLVLTPKDLTTLVSPEAGDIACDINDNNKIKKYDAVSASWTEVGSGASSLDSIFQLIGDDVTSWSKGNNASFLGGGSLAGTFVADSVTPLHGPQSYKYTQAAGSLNDYIASPAKSVDSRFKGQTCILSFPFNYNGNANDIEVVIYDATNAAVIPSSIFITSSSNTSILTSYVTIPLTCSSIRVGFKVAVANSGKILNFDDVQLSQTSLYTPQPESQAIYASTGNGFGSTNTQVRRFSSVSNSSNSILRYEDSPTLGASFTALKSCIVNVSYSEEHTGASGSIFGPTINSSTTGYLGISQGETGASRQTTSANVKLNAGDVLRAVVEAGARHVSSSALVRFSITATASSDQILTAPETFSTDTAALQYASSAAYTLATLNTAPVGTYITFTYATSTNTRTQTTTRPTQTDANMNANGMLIYTRAYNAASTAAQPAVIAIQIGKGLKGVTKDLYKSAGKTTPGSLDLAVGSVNAYQRGMMIKEYSEVTGVLILDAGLTTSNSVTTSTLDYSDTTTQTSGYLVINASKNPALTGLGLGTVAARGVNSAATSISNVANVTLTYDSVKTFDTNGALNAATGVFTAPESGYYNISWLVTFVDSLYAVGNRLTSVLIIDGNAHSSGSSWEAEVATTSQVSSSGTSAVFLTKGSQAYIQVTNSRGAGATSLRAAGNENYFSIAKTSIGTGN